MYDDIPVVQPVVHNIPHKDYIEDIHLAPSTTHFPSSAWTKAQPCWREFVFHIYKYSKKKTFKIYI